MKKWIYVFMFLAVVALGFNILQIEWSAPFEGNSLVACIGVLASACALLLLVLLSQSLKIAQKLKRK
jgi:hypothetical protein